MKNLWKKWIFIAQFHFKDPDPDSESGLAIWIRIQNTAYNTSWMFLPSSEGSLLCIIYLYNKSPIYQIVPNFIFFMKILLQRVKKISFE